MKELLLLRHAKAKKLTKENGVEDKNRALKKRGKRDAKNIGNWLKKQHLLPDVLLSSTAKRAIDTSTIVYSALNAQNLIVHANEQLYGANVEQLLAVLASYPKEVKRILLVGHNPELESLLVYLVGKDALPNGKKLLSTATLVRLTIDNAVWSELAHQRIQLVSITHAADC